MAKYTANPAEHGYCEYCLSNPHKSGCPNADDGVPLFYCDGCGNGIYDGDNYFEADGVALCERCCKRKTAYKWNIL